MKKQKLSLHIKILLGLLFGVIYGICAIHFDIVDFTSFWIKPWGTIFIRLLKLVAIPLIFVSLVQGITSMKNIAQLSKLGVKTFVLYIITTIIAVSTGLVVVKIINPAQTFPSEKREQLLSLYKEQVGSIENKTECADKSPLQTIVDIVPENIIGSASDNKNMLQVIFFAFLFGISIVIVGEERAKTVIDFFEASNHVFIVLVQLIMKYAPIGVFALLASLIVEVAGNSSNSTLALLSSLGLYAITVVLGLFFLLLVLYPMIVHFFSNISVKKFVKGLLPAQLVAFTTSSSVATLPVSMQQCEQALNLNPSTVSFVLPIGATINMDGTALYQSVAAVFIANVFGFDLTLTQQLTIVLTATLASIGSAGVPSAGIIMLIIVLESINIPAAGVALILAVDRPLDMLRTIVNVTGDCMVCSIIDKSRNSNHATK